MTRPAPDAARPGPTVRSALRLLRRHAGPAYLAAVGATLVNTVPDVVRQLLVYDDPRLSAAVVVDAVGLLTGLVAQLWVTGALAGLPRDGRLRARGALGRGTALAWRAVRTAPATVLAGVLLGGAVSALLTVPATVAALGVGGMIGPLDAPSAAAFTVATVSDVVASAVTLPFLALVLVLAGSSGRRAGTGEP
ncbi:hypothetical protein [Geodermatophilus marinus]|uniref:hypothetical protein n=1 Tax=Geodermatophilus sp. LHW52908 TaxID=2303986 RepID=UPI000E3DCCDB|nr:hypothetical protein [Geodermatophilus sp. LHW52908]RFU21612.1 hypothetical protein D0Z06_10465 [Geodermatophilus sp. LHW52908]